MNRAPHLSLAPTRFHLSFELACLDSSGTILIGLIVSESSPGSAGGVVSVCLLCQHKAHLLDSYTLETCAIGLHPKANKIADPTMTLSLRRVVAWIIKLKQGPDRLIARTYISLPFPLLLGFVPCLQTHACLEIVRTVLSSSVLLSLRIIYYAFLLIYGIIRPHY